MTLLRRDMHEKNRLSWNEATRAHNSHKRDQAGFLRDGGSTLYPEELDLLGDLQGKRLCHLQCNSGQDTLSLARLGAIVTGVDISDEAVSFAQDLSRDAGIPGTFVRSDVYDYFTTAPEASFDIVFCSYGALCWLSDIALWGKGVARLLAPKGRLAFVDSHPFMMVLSEQTLGLKYAYGGGEAVPDPGVNDYVARAGEALTPSGWEEGVKDFVNPHPDVSFQWGMDDILMAVLTPGLRLTRVVEYPFTRWRAFDTQLEDSERRFRLPPSIPQIPQMLGVVAMKD
ncbi:MAG: class I SAM-dependent methyltransferase [Polyangiaceae bacterium]